MAPNGSKRKTAFRRMLEQNRQMGIDRDRANEAAMASRLDAQNGTTSTPEPWSPAKLLSIEDLQGLVMETTGIKTPTKSVDELTREAVSWNEKILEARSRLPLKDTKSIEELEQKRDQILNAIRELDPTKDFTEESLALSTHKYHPSYYKFSAAAARGENVPDNELVMTIPFHPKNPDKFFKGAVEQRGSGLCKVLRDTAIASMIIGDLTYQEKQSIAVASKESFLLVGRIMEVWNTNCHDFLGKDKSVHRVGMTEDGRPVEMVASWSDILKVKYKAKIDRHKEKLAHISEPGGRKTACSLVRDIMMVDVPHSNAEPDLDKELEPIGLRGYLNVMATGVRFAATKATRNKSPRLKYSDELEASYRLLEVISNHGASIRSLDLSGQHMLTWHHVDLMLLGMPNIRQLTLRDNHLLDITQTQNLMESVQRRRPDCVLDFYPFYFYGPSYESGRATDKDRCGSFGLTFEDSGVCTNNAVALMIRDVLAWEKKFGVKMLAPGLGFRHFLDRLPVPVGFAADIIASHAWLESMRAQGMDDEVHEMAHHRRIHEIVTGKPAHVGSKKFEVVTCKECGIKMSSALMHSKVKCSWCCLQVFAFMEPHRYKHEKRALVDNMLPWNGFCSRAKSLSELLSGVTPATDDDDDGEEDYDDQDGNGEAENNAADDETGQDASNENAVEPEPETEPEPEPEPLRVSLYSVPEWERWKWASPTPIEKLVYRGFADARTLEWWRLRDILRMQEPELAPFEPTNRFVDDMRLRGWHDRGPGDHEMFPIQQRNIFDRRVTEGSFIQLAPGICIVRRPNTAEALINRYKPAACMDEMRKLMFMEPKVRKELLESTW
ncbi:hypothetical protein MAPG_00416 [Magnaporthiopsis poae ATCC 64411]|uniref:Uncharacterized protein n=1 Tax=Magnaporthiopsis poae (strain ATCC 64411 / 73-15) TaxID=644358 RepID=A0A0C4DKY4_MAGP6|nr:hypothetical protein MAPG_00416 [Magnaporthiopsis poae ATCC 64411]